MGKFREYPGILECMARAGKKEENSVRLFAEQQA